LSKNHIRREAMLEIKTNFPENVLAIRASGQVTKKDYKDILLPAAKEAFEKNKELRVYYEIEEDSGFDLGAMWEDMSLGVNNWSKWDKVALITDKDWIKNAASTFGFFMPCPVKTFKLTEREQAKIWISS